MKINNKKILISIFIFFIIILLSISGIIANNAITDLDAKIDKEKIYQEIKYFDFQIIYMMNLLSNIEQENNFYINWEQLSEQTTMLYTYWNSVILDLNNLDITKKELTDFGKYLDKLSISIKNQDRQSTLENCLELYNKLIVYAESLNYNENNINILYAKYNLLIAYSIAEKGNWTLIYESILHSSDYLFKMVNSINNNPYNQYNINQSYIAVKELENIINVRDINIFYLKYNITINKLQNI